MKLFIRTLFPVACAVVLLSAAVSPAQDEGQPPAAAASHPAVVEPQATQPQSSQAKQPEAPPAAPAEASGTAGPRVVAPPADEAKTSPADAGAAPQLPPDRRADAAPKAAAAANGAAASYVIGALDVLYIRVWGNQNLTGMVDVRPDGMISMPLIGEVKADGATPAQLTQTLKTRLEDFLIKPEVDVQVTKVNSKRFYIFGQVGRPGEFPLIGPLTVLDALSSAGGFRDFANQKKIYILRGTQKLPFNYKDVSQGKHMEQNIFLQNGDRIFVP